MLELGCGQGMCGLVAAHFAQSVCALPPPDRLNGGVCVRDGDAAVAAGASGDHGNVWKSQSLLLSMGDTGDRSRPAPPMTRAPRTNQVTLTDYEPSVLALAELNARAALESGSLAGGCPHGAALPEVQRSVIDMIWSI